MLKNRFSSRPFLLILLLPLMAGCAGGGPSTETMVLPEVSSVDLAAGEELSVVATTSIIGDVVAQVGGDLIDLTVLMPLGQNPHSYEATPGSFAAIEGADLVFVNGLGLEEALLASIEEAARGPIVPISTGLEVLGGVDEGEGNDHPAGDPHFWVDPNNVMVWVENIRAVLSAADPASAEFYQANADAYQAELVALDSTIRDRVAVIPQVDRKLITDHETFTYFADEYGFEIVGAVIPSFTTTSGASAGDIAALVELIKAEDVPAIFIGTTADQGLQALAETIASEAGIEIAVLPLLEGSLAPAGEPGDSYLSYMAYNMEQIVAGLTGQ